MTARPLVSVYDGVTGNVVGTAKLPAVFNAPVRNDVVNFVHDNMAKNHRQPYAVSTKAGHNYSAESWGTGRAVARIPRISGGGTHRSGQGAFGNQCRGGHMFAPTKIWRRWHRRINLTMKRHAVASALAASASAPLVQARGHRVSNIPQIPLVISTESISPVNKTKKAVEMLKKIGAYDDIKKVIESRKLRAGKGKMRNRRHVQRKGPLIIFKERSALIRAFRNIPGVDLCCVTRLNLLTLAPGGHLGRFIIWTQDAFEDLDHIFGTYKVAGTQKGGYRLVRAKMTNPDLTRLLTSDEIHHVLRPRQRVTKHPRKRNPLKHLSVMVRLNPYAAAMKNMAKAQQKRALAIKEKRLAVKAPKKRSPKLKAKIKKSRKLFKQSLFV